MIKDEAYQTNGEPIMAAIPVHEKADALLLYQAKQNVNYKRNLVKHAVSYVIVWMFLGVFFAATIDNMRHPRFWNMQSGLGALDQVMQYIPEEQLWAVDELRWTIEWYFGIRYIPDIWYAAVGIMLAWGGWIVVRATRMSAKSIKKKLRLFSTKTPKPDPVMQEYNRLKDMTTDDMM